MEKLVFFILTFILLSSGVTQLNYQVGQQFSYILHANLDARGHDEYGTRTNGSFATMDSTVVTQCIDQDDTSYLFVMNMFGTQVNVGQGDSISTQTARQVTDDDGLGYDMYYQQKKTGEIEKIWYNTGDSVYFVNVKVGAINAFQTYIVNPGNKQLVLENDPVGVHYSTFQGTNGQASSLLLNKTFSALDVQAFADPNLKPNNVKISAVTNTGIHAAGYILSASVDQLVDVINVGPELSKKASSMFQGELLVNDGDNRAVDSMLSSKGHLEINLSTVGNSSTRFRSAYGFKELASSQNYTGDSMFNVASFLVAQAKKTSDFDVGFETLNTILRMGYHKKLFLVLNKLVRYFDQRPEELHKLEELAQYIPTSVNIRKNLFYLLANLNNHDAHKLLVQRGLDIKVGKEVVLNAILAMHDITNPDKDLLTALENQAQIATDDAEVKHAALLTYGALCGRANTYPEYLFRLLKSSESDDEKVTVIHAIGNAGPSAVPLDEFPVSALVDKNPEIRRAGVFALRKYEEPDALMVIQKLIHDSEYLVRRAAAQALKENQLYQFESSDFPFNKSFIKNLTLGGKEINAHFNGQLFLGSNFDCNQKYFNYEGLAEVDSLLNLFGWSKSAFEAQAIYGRKNGQTVGDRLYVRVWNDVIYNQPIPSLDCKEHTYEIGHTSKGLSVSYTLWVSVIPVTFTASGNIALDLSWGWSICDAELSAMVELIPKATLSIAGGAEIDLLIIKAGLDLTGSFNTQLRPQGYIHGANCSVGIDVEQVSDPMAVDFTSYYAWKKCKYWVFDCHWGNHDEHTWFHWGLPPVNKVLFDENWKIQP